MRNNSLKLKRKVKKIQEEFAKKTGAHITEAQAILIGLMDNGERLEFNARLGHGKKRKVRLSK